MARIYSLAAALIVALTVMNYQQQPLPYRGYSVVIHSHGHSQITHCRSVSQFRKSYLFGNCAPFKPGSGHWGKPQ